MENVGEFEFRIEGKAGPLTIGVTLSEKTSFTKTVKLSQTISCGAKEEKVVVGALVEYHMSIKGERGQKGFVTRYSVMVVFTKEVK